MFKKKTIIAFWLLLLVAMPLIIFSFLQLKQQYIHHNMEEKLEKASLQTITLSSTDFTWVKKHKEIKIGNEMFDVKSYSNNNNKFVFIGVYDAAEKKIKNQINLLLNNNKADKHFSDLLALKIFQISFLISSTISLEPIILCDLENNYPFFKENILAANTAINTPPPNL
jgi:hypothetical protein